MAICRLGRTYEAIEMMFKHILLATSAVALMALASVSFAQPNRDAAAGSEKRNQRPADQGKGGQANPQAQGRPQRHAAPQAQARPQRQAMPQTQANPQAQGRPQRQAAPQALARPNVGMPVPNQTTRATTAPS